MMPPFKIQVRSLCKRFGDKVVLDHLDLDLTMGESFCLIGGSGTGKSVLIKCILGLMAPDKGTIYVDGVDMASLSSHQRESLQRRLGMLFQGGALFDSLPVWRNIAFGLLQQRSVTLKEAQEIAIELLGQVNLSPSVASLFPSELSGGMQKRVALARAIACAPEVIFFDEPTTGLDPITSGVINNLIVKCVRQLGASAITITHDLASLRAIADRVGLLFQGRLIWQGTLEEMDKTSHPHVVQFIHGHLQGPFTDDLISSQKERSL